MSNKDTTVYVKYNAFSNISFWGEWKFRLGMDPKEWAELSEDEKYSYLTELVQDKLSNDIEWHISREEVCE